MGSLTTNNFSKFTTIVTSCRKFGDPNRSPRSTPPILCYGFKANVRAFASQKSVKKSRKKGKTEKTDTAIPDKYLLSDDVNQDYVEDNKNAYPLDTSEAGTSVPMIPSRGSVLKACIITSGLIGLLGIVIREGTHVAAAGGLPIVDCSVEIPVTFQMWHLELITGLVILVSSCRYLLLKVWPDFAESSEAANSQVLSSLEPLDYIVVSLLPGISEELLFRGALLPLFGINWLSVVATASIFGILHLGSGRKYSFAVWATFVGIVYGYATILSSTVVVPMAAHAVNNLVGGIIWRYTSNSSK
ncbi:hypothetical protein R3W88_014340 [Solanum pinnatisectum]|uniref:CAAX prenyl protease 2/Lysostaphin resistance protein A-like domain-containing protein n=1 Tax=Solanum pinnatisectum TaxID=50273 RepID=A0AAV9KRF8_9SOLN|nr:hypothetical protein R3W88_014340 [Solanum pinnatisectum]